MLLSRSLRRSMTLLGLLALLVGPSISAQAGTLGGISGHITDAKTGAPVAGARIEISSPSQSTTATTDARGHYIALSLQPDDYTLTITKDGYATRSVSGYSVNADQTQVYDFQVNEGSSSE